MAKHVPDHLAHQVAGLSQQGQQDLYHHLHPHWFLGGYKWESRFRPSRTQVAWLPSLPQDNDAPLALERDRRGFCSILFLMQVWMSPRTSQLSVGDCGWDKAEVRKEWNQSPQVGQTLAHPGQSLLPFRMGT